MLLILSIPERPRAQLCHTFLASVRYVKVQPCMIGETGETKVSPTVGCVSPSGLWIESITYFIKCIPFHLSAASFARPRTLIQACLCFWSFAGHGGGIGKPAAGTAIRADLHGSYGKVGTRMGPIGGLCRACGLGEGTGGSVKCTGLFFSHRSVFWRLKKFYLVGSFRCSIENERIGPKNRPMTHQTLFFFYSFFYR